MTPRTTPTDGTFESPFKPPPGVLDFLTDLEYAPGEPHYTHVTNIGGLRLRYRVPPPGALVTFTTALSTFNTNQAIRHQQRLRFISENIHPDDRPGLISKLVDPDSGFGDPELETLIRELGRAGTARPTVPSPRSRRRH